MQVFSSSHVLTNNVIVANQSSGIQVEGDGHLRLLYNTLAANAVAGAGLYLTHYVDLWVNLSTTRSR